MSSSAVRQTNKWRLSASVRKSVVVLHAVSGIGWMGVDIALLVLLINAQTTNDPSVAAAGYTAVGMIVPAVLPTLSLSILVTGLVLGWGTQWGVLRYWWVLIKLLLSVGMTALVFFQLVPMIHRMPAIANPSSAATLRQSLGPLTIQLMFPPIVSFLLLCLATVLSIFKPWRRTPWAR